MHDHVVLRYGRVPYPPGDSPTWVIASEHSYRFGDGGIGVRYNPRSGRFTTHIHYASLRSQPPDARVEMWRLNDLPDDIAAAYLAWLHKFDRQEIT